MTIEAHSRKPIHLRRDAEPAPSMSVDPANLFESARQIVLAIISLNDARWGGVLLFVDHDRQAYLISAERRVAERWTREKLTWLVGAYKIRHTKKLPKLALTVEGVAADLEEHLRGLA